MVPEHFNSTESHGSHFLAHPGPKRDREHLGVMSSILLEVQVGQAVGNETDTCYLVWGLELSKK